MNVHRGCNDFHHTNEAERARFLDSPLTRRQVIGAGLGASLAFYASRALPLGGALDAATAASASMPDTPVLVCVFLPGGLDLMDSLVPLHQEGRYADLRGATRVLGAKKLGSTGLGIHPSLEQGPGGGIKGLFDRGQVAFLPGIDYANPDFSHFHSRQFWESGVVTAKQATGWLGRFLDAAGSAENPFQGVTLAPGVSPLLRSAGAPVAALTGLDAAGLPFTGVSEQERALSVAALADLARHVDGSSPGREAVARSVRQAVQVAATLAPHAAAKPAAPSEDVDGLLTGVAQQRADTLLARSLATTARLISLPLGVRVATVSANSDFDTHSGQQTRLQSSLTDVSTSLAQFQADLEAAGVADRVLTLVWSEFGRRAKANSSGGTDHGAAGLAWLQGPRVRGGIATDYPDLATFDRYGNLQVTVDFRRLYSSLLEQWLGVEAAQIIPGAAGFGRVALVQ